MENTSNTHKHANEVYSVLPAVLDYFGTDIDCAGHFFWQLEGNRMRKTDCWFNKIPFNPEELLPSNMPKGSIKYFRVEKYAIIAIVGSCADNRNGTKSVFWTDKEVKLGDLKAIILSIPIAKKIIETMPFDVAW